MMVLRLIAATFLPIFVSFLLVIGGMIVAELLMVPRISLDPVFTIAGGGLLGIGIFYLLLHRINDLTRWLGEGSLLTSMCEGEES